MSGGSSVLTRELSDALANKIKSNQLYKRVSETRTEII